MARAWQVGQWPRQVQEQAGRAALGAGGGMGTEAAMPSG